MSLSDHGGPEAVVMDPLDSSVYWRGAWAHLTPHQYSVLACLLAAKGASVTHDRILQEAWGYIPARNAAEVLRAQIAGLRRALRKAGIPDRLIQSVWGGKYRLALPPSDDLTEVAS